jgi:hypothetical protein
MRAMMFMGCKSILARLLLLVACMVLLSPAAYASSDEQRAAARSLATKGSEAYKEKRFSDAVDLFSRAEALVHSPVHLLFMARAHEEMGQLVKAQEAYIKIVRESLSDQTPRAFRNAQRQASRELKKLEPRLGRLVVHVENPAGTKVMLTLDDAPVADVLVGVPMPVDPGTHEIRASAEGASTASEEVTIQEGDSESVQLSLTALPQPELDEADEEEADAGGEVGADEADFRAGADGSPALRYVGYTMIGVGVVGLGIGTYFALEYGRLDSAGDKLFNDNNCGNPNTGCSIEIQDSIDEKDRLRDDAGRNAVAAFVAGGVLSIAGVTLAIVGSGSGEDEALAPRIKPWIAYDRVGISGTF